MKINCGTGICVTSGGNQNSIIALKGSEKWGKKTSFLLSLVRSTLPQSTYFSNGFLCVFSHLCHLKSQGARACMACLGRPSSPLLDVSSLTLLISEGLFPAFYLIPSPVTQSQCIYKCFLPLFPAWFLLLHFNLSFGYHSVLPFLLLRLTLLVCQTTWNCITKAIYAWKHPGEGS